MTKLWNKNFTLCWISNIFYALNFFTLMATIADYTVNKYGAAPDIAGLCVSIFVIGSLFSRIVTGALIGVVHRRKMLLFGGIAVFVSVLLYFVPMGLGAFLLVRTVNGMAWGVVCNLLNALVLDYILEGRLGEGIGYYTMGNPLGSGVGPLIGIFVITSLGIYVFFGYITFTAIVALVLIPLIKVGMLEQESNLRSARKRPSLGTLFERNAMPISLVTILMTICYSAVPAFMQLYTAERGASWVAPFYFLAYSTVVVLIRPFAGKLQDKKGDNPIIIPTLCIFGVGILLLSFASHPIAFFAVAVLSGLGYGSFFSGFQTIAVGVAPPEKSGLAMSTVYIFADTGMGVGPYIWGLIVKSSGYSTAFLIEAIVVACAVVLYYIAHGRLDMAKRKRSE